MGRREDVDNSIWADDDFLELSAHARYLYLWSFTNPHCNMAGLYKIARRMMVLETGLTAKQLEAALDELTAAGFLAVHDGTIWVCSRLKYVRSKGSSIARNVAKDLAFFDDDHPLKVALVRRYGDTPWLSDELSGVSLAEPKPDTPSTPGAQPVHGLPGRAGPVVKEELPTSQSDARAPELPKPLAPFLAPVADALRRVAQSKPGAIAVQDAAVGKSLADFPNKDFLALVKDFEHYWIHGAGGAVRRKDIVATWRNWLTRQPDVLRKTAPGGGSNAADRSRSLIDSTESRLAAAEL